MNISMYGKVFASLYQGSLRGMSNEILVFTNLIAHQDQDGHVDKHWRAIADETGLTEEQVKAALKTLESPDPESRTPDFDGARIVRLDEHRSWGWFVVNAGYYNGLKNAAERREQLRQAQQRLRDKRKEKGVITRNQSSSSRNQESSPIDIATTTSKATDIPEELQSQDGFPEAWESYLKHRKQKKKPVTNESAKRLFKKLLKNPSKAVELIETAIDKGWTGMEFEWLNPNPKCNSGPAEGGTPQCRDAPLAPDEEWARQYWEAHIKQEFRMDFPDNWPKDWHNLPSSIKSELLQAL